ncbi:hypothetical protein C8R44DRAFT_859181 [Mycena epipterygia]|nr:hypothetical protein C8R44DRAFT_859181 [Mycena epipterygia]
MAPTEPPRPRPLRIAIVGAGIAGLAAAAALRMEGHEVLIFESSSMNKEIGAAITLSANALRVLTYLGVNLNNLRAGDYLGVMWFDSKGGDGKFDALHDPDNTFGRYGLLCHRSELHDELKRLGTAEEGPGKPVTIHLKCDVRSCDPTAGTLTLKNGAVHHADLTIGADGIHSIIRTSVLGYEQIAPASGRAAFCCLFDASKWRAALSLIDWNAPTTKTALLEAFSDYDAQFAALLALTDGPVHLWQMRALPCLPTWIKDCVALIGDAAHATFPTIGQGASMSVEDAVTLACLLPPGTTEEQIPARLEAYQTLRKERGEFVLRESVEQVTIPSKRGLYSRSPEMQAYIVRHDAVKVAKEYLAAHFTIG